MAIFKSFDLVRVISCAIFLTRILWLVQCIACEQRGVLAIGCSDKGECGGRVGLCVCVWGGCFIDLFFFKTEVIFWFCSQSEVAEEFFLFILFFIYIIISFCTYLLC